MLETLVQRCVNFNSNQRKESRDTLLITVKNHQGAVYCCRFSQDASKVVSCGADRTVKVKCSGIPTTAIIIIIVSLFYSDIICS